MTTPSSNKEPNWKYFLEKVLSWQFIFIVIFFMFFNTIKKKVNESNEIKMGDFQIRVNKIAESYGFSDVVKDLNNLTYEELKLFLIIGGKDGNFYTFSPNSLYPHGRLEEMYKNLNSNGLIEKVNPTDIPGIKQLKDKPSFGFKTTLKGEKVHQAILDAIYSDLKKPEPNN